MTLSKSELKLEIEASKELFFETEFTKGGFHLEFCS